MPPPAEFSKFLKKSDFMKNSSSKLLFCGTPSKNNNFEKCYQVGELNLDQTSIHYDELTKHFNEKDYLIVECSFQPSLSFWKLECIRFDKSHANSFKTAWDIMETSIENLTMETIENTLRDMVLYQEDF